MAVENHAFGESLLNVPVSAPFDKVVAFEMGGEWLAVEDASQALRMLEDFWPGKQGPSHTRAHAACKAYLDGDGSSLAARASFSVALMELGLPFRLFDDAMEFLDFQVEAMTEQNVRRQAD